MITRRHLLTGVGSVVAGSVGLADYGLAVEPRLLAVTRYRITPASWPAAIRLNVGVLADLHACEPWMGLGMIERIVAEANALRPDLFALLGDYETHHRYVSGRVAPRDWAKALAGLKAPLGVHAVLGNHDWWDDAEAMRRERGPVEARRALEKAGIPVYENHAISLAKNGQPFWLAGLGDQWAFRRRSVHKRGQPYSGYRGVHDLPATLGRATGEAPVILLAHEPDIFPKVPARVAVTLAGHTHGGQVRVLGYSPIVPSVYGRRYAYGHIIEDGRHMIVSGGLGCSFLPVRLGVPPEIVLVEIGGGRERA